MFVCCVAAPNVGRVGFAAGVPNDNVFDVPNDGVDVVVVAVWPNVNAVLGVAVEPNDSPAVGAAPTNKTKKQTNNQLLNPYCNACGWEREIDVYQMLETTLPS